VSIDKVIDKPDSDAAAPVMDRRKGIGRTVDKLVNERQSVFVTFCELAGVSTIDLESAERHTVRPEKLNAFLELLMDYLGTGHFELYQRIIDGHERRRLVLDAGCPNLADCFGLARNNLILLSCRQLMRGAPWLILY